MYGSRCMDHRPRHKTNVFQMRIKWQGTKKKIILFTGLKCTLTIHSETYILISGVSMTESMVINDAPIVSNKPNMQQKQ